MDRYVALYEAYKKRKGFLLLLSLIFAMGLFTGCRSPFTETDYAAAIMGGIAVLYENEWYLCTPSRGGADEAEQVSAEVDPLEAAVSAAILEYNKDGYSQKYFPCESHVILDTETVSGTVAEDGSGHMQYVTVYAMALYQVYDLSSGAISDEGGSHMAVAITFAVNETGEYTVEEYWTPMDGSGYEPSIREKFPDHIEDNAIDTQPYILAQIQNCYDQAVRHGNLDTEIIVAKLLDEIISSPGLTPQSGLAWYIQNEHIAYRELTYYGKYTLEACFQEFSKGGQTDLRGLLMAEVCEDIMLGFGEAVLLEYEPANGQEWFEAFRANGGDELRELGWLPATDDEKLSADGILKEPPVLTLKNGGKRVTALTGTYSWEYQNPDGTFTGIEVDSLHPLDSREMMPELVISQVEETGEIPFYAILQFEGAPDEVSVSYWEESCWNEVSAKSKEIEVRRTKVTLENGSKTVIHFNIDLQEENGIYEVAARWNSSEEYSGTAYYSFCTSMQDGEAATIEVQ